MCGAPEVTGTVAGAAAAKGAIAGTAIGACCEYTTGAVMGSLGSSNISNGAPQVMEMTRRGGKTRKRKYKKRNKRKTKRRLRKKTNKRNKRKTKSKRKFNKKTRGNE